MTVTNQRDLDLVETIRKLRGDVDTLTGTVISRWGRVPIIGADPASPPDGSVWARSDLGGIRARINGATIPMPRVGAGAPAGTGISGEEYWDTTNARLYRSDGVGWIVMAEPAQTFAPTLANITIGDGSIFGESHRSDGWCDVYEGVIFGSTTSITSSSPTLGLPYQAAHIGGAGLTVIYNDIANLNYQGLVYGTYGPASAVNIYTVSTTGSYGVLTTISNTIPFTFGVGDYIEIQGRYRMNSRYS